jgi:hypothetical protein
MKFITVEPLSTGGELLYITEGATRVSVGDIVEAKVYERPRYHRVLKVGTTRKTAGSTYKGAVKTIERVVAGRELKAVERYQRAKDALERAGQTLDREQGRARELLAADSFPEAVSRVTAT